MSTPTEPTVVQTANPVSQHGEVVGGGGPVEDPITPEMAANAYPFKVLGNAHYVDDEWPAVKNPDGSWAAIHPDAFDILKKNRDHLAAGESLEEAPEDASDIVRTAALGALPAGREEGTVKIKRRETDEERRSREGAASAPAPATTAAKTTTTSKTTTASASA